MERRGDARGAGGADIGGLELEGRGVVGRDIFAADDVLVLRDKYGGECDCF